MIPTILKSLLWPTAATFLHQSYTQSISDFKSNKKVWKELIAYFSFDMTQTTQKTKKWVRGGPEEQCVLTSLLTKIWGDTQTDRKVRQKPKRSHKPQKPKNLGGICRQTDSKGISYTSFYVFKIRKVG
jgi:hypothetical protein